MESKRSRLVSLVLINIRVLVTLLLMIEITGQFVYLFRHGQFRFLAEPLPENPGHKMVFERHPWLTGRLRAGKTHVFGTNTLTATGSRIRWTGADEKDTSLFRIACLGGSTTFCVHLTDSESWPAMLQQKLGKSYAVYNYGLIGYSTTEAIIQTALQLPAIRPDMIIYYEGWNDIRNYHEPDPSPDSYNHGMQQIVNFDVWEEELKCRNAFDAFMKFSGITYLTEATRNFIINYFRKKGILPPKVNFVQPEKIFTTPDPYADQVYYRNLKTLRTLAQAQNAVPMFIPQVMNYRRYADKKNTSGAWTPYIDNASFPELMEHFNSLMDSLAVPGSSLVLKDIRSGHDWDADCFVDDGHFSKKGADRFSDILSQAIINFRQAPHAVP